jgi:diguanylate cyclase (GGDEF)-like protein
VTCTNSWELRQTKRSPSSDVETSAGLNTVDTGVLGRADGQPGGITPWDEAPTVTMGIARIVLRLGVYRAVTLTAFVCAALSVLITYVSLRCFGVHDGSFWFAAIVTALVAPLVIATLLALFLLSMLYQLDASRSLVRRLATIDGLTGLYQRHCVVRQAELELRSSQRNNWPMSVIMLDADHFKQINDQFGHAAGDTVLRTVAQKCHRSVRAGDIVGRYGGEEFLVLLPRTDSVEALVVAERVRKSIAESHIALQIGPTIPVSVSLGVASRAPSTRSLEELLSRADRALYLAKARGRNRIEVDVQVNTEHELTPGKAAYRATSQGDALT